MSLLGWAGKALGEDGRHTETLLATLGAMSGFACQIAIREAVLYGQLAPEGALVEMTAADGAKLYFGDQLNQPLLEMRPSVWTIIGEAATQTGALMPDMHELAGFVAQAGGDGYRPHSKFGKLRVSASHQPRIAPLEALKLHWFRGYRYLHVLGAEPFLTAHYFAMAAKFLIVGAPTKYERARLDPTIACQIALEAAVMMSKVDPDTVGYPWRNGPFAKWGL